MLKKAFKGKPAEDKGDVPTQVLKKEQTLKDVKWTRQIGKL